MPGHLKLYKEYCDKNYFYKMQYLAHKLKGTKIQFISSEFMGGCVKESVLHIKNLLAELGVSVTVDEVKKGTPYDSTLNAFRKAMFGDNVIIKSEMFNEYVSFGQMNTEKIKITGDIVLTHDLETLVMVREKYKTDAKWVWHNNVNSLIPDREVWEYLKNFIEEYDSLIFNVQTYRRNIQVPHFLVPYTINPFSDKNRPLLQAEIKSILKKYGLERNKPIVAQVARFDYVKDPIGVIEAYRMVKKYCDCQLVLAGTKDENTNGADEIINDLKERSKNDPNIHIIVLDNKDIDINAIQQAADIIVQKSVREEFALTITECLWKEKPVVASCLADVPQQIIHNYNGLLCSTIGGCAAHIKRILNNPPLGRRLGLNGRDHVKANFLAPRQLNEYMMIFLYLFNPMDIISLYDI